MATKKQSFATTNGLRLGWTLAALVAVAATPLTATGADRMVICEEFSNTG